MITQALKLLARGVAKELIGIAALAAVVAIAFGFPVPFLGVVAAGLFVAWMIDIYEREAWLSRYDGREGDE